MRKVLRWLTAPALLPVAVRLVTVVLAALLADPLVAPPLAAAALGGLCEGLAAARQSVL